MAKHQKLMVLALGSAITVSMAGIQPASAQTISGMQDQVHKQQQQLNEIGKQKTQAIQKVYDLNREMADAKKQIGDTQADMKKTNKKVDRLKKEIMKTQKRVDRRNDLLKKRVRVMYENGSTVRYLEVLLNSQDFSDFLDRAFALNLVAKQDRKLLNAQIADKKQLESDKKDIVRSLDNLQKQLDSLKDLKNQIKEKKQKQKALVDQLAKQGVDIKKNIQATQQSIQTAQAEAAQRKAEQQVAEAGQQEIKQKEKTAVRHETTVQHSNKPDHVQQSDSDSNSHSNSNSKSDAGHHRTTASPSHSEHHSRPAVTHVSHGSGSVSDILAASRKYFGNSVYVFGGGRTEAQIQNGIFDCSGFVHWAYQQIGVSVGSSTSVLSNTGTRVSYSNIKPGDMVFFDTYKKDGHVGIYIGNGQFLGSQTSTGVAIASMNSGYWKSHFHGHVQRVL